MKKILALLMLTTLSLPALTCSIDGKDGFVEENNLYIPANLKGIKTGISKETFMQVIDKLEGIYAPIISQKGGKLAIERNWDSGTVNAYARQAGKTWHVAMFGGLARHQTITADGFALVLCHEIGHHIGGAPKKGGVSTGGGGWGGGTSGGVLSWASNEGQSDYFATLKCLRQMFMDEDNASVVRNLKVTEFLKSSCSKTYKGNTQDINICIRAAMAGDSVARLFQSLRSESKSPSFDTPDSKVVTKNDDNHPGTQCRMDTYYQGAICDMDMREDVSQTDEVKGTCHSSKGDTSGVRPLCWFKPAI